jgi:hypothetical protein
MRTRTRDRLKALEAKIVPKVRNVVFVFFDAGEPGVPSREWLAAFRAEHGIARMAGILRKAQMNTLPRSHGKHTAQLALFRVCSRVFWAVWPAG